MYKFSWSTYQLSRCQAQVSVFCFFPQLAKLELDLCSLEIVQVGIVKLLV